MHETRNIIIIVNFVRNCRVSNTVTHIYAIQLNAPRSYTYSQTEYNVNFVNWTEKTYG